MSRVETEPSGGPAVGRGRQDLKDEVGADTTLSIKEESPESPTQLPPV